MFNRSFMCMCVHFIDWRSLNAHVRWQHDVHTIQAINDMLLSIHRFFAVAFFVFYNFVPFLFVFFFSLFFFSRVVKLSKRDIERRPDEHESVWHLLIFTWLLLHYAHVMANGLPLHNIGIYKIIIHCLCQMKKCMHARTSNKPKYTQSIPQ